MTEWKPPPMLGGFMPNSFGGVKVLVSEHATSPVDARLIRLRTWRERWLSWPWRPKRRWADAGQHPDEPACYRTPQGLIVHPKIYRSLRS